MAHSHNPFFVGRQAELARFAQLLVDGEPLTILDVHGHSGVGKTWLLEEFRSTCSNAQIPFAYLNPRQLSGDPVSLLTGFARRMGLGGEWDEASCIFDQLLPPFVTALCALDTPVAMLMLDNYDLMLHFDPQVRHLIRHLMQPSPPDGHTLSPTYGVGHPRFIVVIGSQMPLHKYWPLNPIYLQPLQEMALCDFTLQETSAYLDRMGIPRERHLSFFRSTQGYPLALALAATLRTSEVLVTSGTLDMQSVGQKVLSPEGRWRLVREILERDLRSLSDDPLRARVIELLYASAVVRRFDRPLLADLLDRSSLPDALFDRVTALSMVVEREQIGKSHTFVLHDALRMALLEDARGKGLEELSKACRCRALALYQARQAKLEPGATVEELALDILFLHTNPAIHSVFFDSMLVPLSTDPVSFDELDGLLEPLMRQNPLYQDIGFDGEPLKRLIRETREWLALDWQLHGETLHYFRPVRRGEGRGSVAGFVLSVPVTAATLPLLRRDTVGQLYEVNVGSISSRPLPSREDARRVFLLRLVVDGWDCLSALMRTFFGQLGGRSFDALIAVTPWPLLGMLAQALGFDLLAEGIEYEGHRYAVLQLDVAQYGGPLEWLLQLVREDLGLLPPGDWMAYVSQVRKALEQLWDKVSVSSQNPLIGTLELAGPSDDALVRVDRLRRAIAQAHERLYVSAEEETELRRQGKASHYRLLDELYGITGTLRRRFKCSANRPSQYVVAELLGVAHPQPFTRLRDAAIEALAEELWWTRFESASHQIPSP